MWYTGRMEAGVEVATKKRWVRYRTRHAWGHSAWTYDFTSREDESIAEACHREYDFSDKYRGCDVEQVPAEAVPADVVGRYIEHLELAIRCAQEDLKEIRSQCR